MSSRNYLLRSFSVFSLCLFSVVIIKKPALLAATSEVRHKRGAVYPASTVIQFSIALAFPFEIPNRKAASNLGVLLNIDLPTNITQLYPYKPESQGRFLSHSVLYDNFEHVLHERGFNGEECILKSICQVAKKILDEEDLSHNLLQVLFRLLRNILGMGHYLNYSFISLLTKLSIQWLILVPLVNSDDSRALVYTNGGVIKLIVGWAVPLELPMSVIFLSNYQWQYNALDNAMKWHQLGRSKQSNYFFSRSHIYDQLKNTLSRQGLNGTSCILKAVCEVAETPFSHNGLLGRFIDLIFRPKQSSVYREAWMKGASGGNCSDYTCERSIFGDCVTTSTKHLM